MSDEDIPSLFEPLIIDTTTPFSFTNLSLFEDPFFDGQHHQNNQYFQLPQFDHDNVAHNQSQPVSSMTQASGKAVANNAKSDQKKKDRQDRMKHRRIRMSIAIASQFFKLDEVLGFNRASKTMKWLLGCAEPEIKKLEGETEGRVSGGEDQEGCNASSKPSEKEKRKYHIPRSKPKRRLTLVTKESRDLARKRARERTREKMNRRFYQLFNVTAWDQSCFDCQLLLIDIASGQHQAEQINYMF